MWSFSSFRQDMGSLLHLCMPESSDLNINNNNNNNADNFNDNNNNSDHNCQVFVGTLPDSVDELLGSTSGSLTLRSLLRRSRAWSVCECDISSIKTAWLPNIRKWERVWRSTNCSSNEVHGKTFCSQYLDKPFEATMHWGIRSIGGKCNVCQFVFQADD